MILNSYAKLNLYLAVLNKRKDNYHNIETLFQRISLCDKIILKSRRDDLIKVACAQPGVPQDHTNLCWRAAKLLQDTCRVKKGVDIRIIKRIPVGAGLGGGSSNAATLLLGLNKAWRLGLSRGRLVKLASLIGSDVPFFIYERAFALGRGRGERISPVNTSARFWHILVVPKIIVSTPGIYRGWDRYSGLTTIRGDVKILTSVIRKKKVPEAGLLFNSLEEITTALYPQVRRAKEALAGLGLKPILMSGSGPSVFGIVSSRKEALSASRQLKNKNRSWRFFVVRTF
ncbi:MAG: 4-(cytidine 5'-diphospho)-2-C-methyl-D-erythritol kinase [Candidatus Omnitrophica bacterium]|nr:4-(cytidine 5'-diphospho)-2-C-methyl-D-erythritol kinase [Candidatus Omnitrophota bacterium]